MADPRSDPQHAEGLSWPVLGKIPLLLDHPKTETLDHVLIGKTFLCKLPGGQLYFESLLDLDTDGSVYYAQDPFGQPGTSAKDAAGHNLDSDQINYFVLPGGLYAQYGIQLGDIGVVIYRARKVYACFGDVGPANKLGEGSIALHRALGHETIFKGKLVNAAIDGGVTTIVFPNSGGDGIHGQTNAESSRIGEQLFQQLQSEARHYEQSLRR
jgi:hypothetical protein